MPMHYNISISISTSVIFSLERLCWIPSLLPHLEPLAQPYLSLMENHFDSSNVLLYRSIVGALQYISNTRPHLLFAANKACQFMARPTTMHWLGVKRILRYLKGTTPHGLILHPSSSLDIQSTQMRIGHNSQTIVEALAAITSSLAPIWCHGRLPNKELSHEVVLSPNIMVFLLLSLKLPGCNLSFDNYAFLNLLRLSSVTSKVKLNLQLIQFFMQVASISKLLSILSQTKSHNKHFQSTTSPLQNRWLIYSPNISQTHSSSPPRPNFPCSPTSEHEGG